MPKRRNGLRRFAGAWCLALAAAGCGGGGEAESDGSTPAASRPPAITDEMFTLSPDLTIEPMRATVPAPAPPRESGRPEYDRAALDRLQADLRGARSLTIHYPRPDDEQPEQDGPAKPRKALPVDDPETLRGALDDVVILRAWEDDAVGQVGGSPLSAEFTLADGARIVLDFRHPDEVVRHWWGSMNLDDSFYARLCALASEAEGATVDPAPARGEPGFLPASPASF